MNDPDAHAPTHISTRWEVSTVEQPWGLCEFGFQGLMHDESTALIHNRARTWLPAAGRFARRDPLGLRGAWFCLLCPRRTAVALNERRLPGRGWG